MKASENALPIAIWDDLDSAWCSVEEGLRKLMVTCHQKETIEVNV